MKIIIPGGTGQLGQMLARHFATQPENEIALLTRGSTDAASGLPSRIRLVQWDAIPIRNNELNRDERTAEIPGWFQELEDADVVINLAGKSVNCRYSTSARKAIIDSRVQSVNAIGQAIEHCKNPPKLWLQASTATIYQHTIDGPANGESNGIIGGNEANIPDTWRFSIEVAKAWEAATDGWKLAKTRVVKMRAAMVMSPDEEGVFDVLAGLVRKRLGGAIAGGNQFVSWIHDVDFVRAIDFVIKNNQISGVVNFSAPYPLRQAEFMTKIRSSCNVKMGLPATTWMVEIGAWFMRTESELVLKSRKVIPERLESEGFEFQFPDWDSAVIDLSNRYNSRRL